MTDKEKIIELLEKVGSKFEIIQFRNGYVLSVEDTNKNCGVDFEFDMEGNFTLLDLIQNSYGS